MGTAPAEGTLGIGVGKNTPTELLRKGEDPFHSIVWFPSDAMDEAKQFAEEFGYIVKEGVPL